jgi:cysteine dioxygenase
MIAQKTPDSIRGICERLDALTAPLSSAEINTLLTQLAGHPFELSAYEHFSDTSYARNRIYRNEIVDILVLCWRTRQRTPIHNHAGSTCGVYIIRGEATEITFKPSGIGLMIPEGSNQLTAGATSISVDSDAHLVGNFASPATDLVTLHCYSPPLLDMQVFTEHETFFADYQAITSSAMVNSCYHARP